MKKLNTTYFIYILSFIISHVFLRSNLTLENLKAVYSINERISIFPILTPPSPTDVVVSLTISCDFGTDEIQQITIPAPQAEDATENKPIPLNIDTSAPKACQISVDLDEVINSFSIDLEVQQAPTGVTPSQENNLEISRFTLERDGKAIYTLPPSIRSTVVSKVYSIHTDPVDCVSFYKRNKGNTAIQQMDFNTLDVNTEFEIRANGNSCVDETKYVITIAEESTDSFISLIEATIIPNTTLTIQIETISETTGGHVTAKLVLSRFLKSSEFSALPLNFTINITDTENQTIIAPNQISLNTYQKEYQFSYDKQQTQNIALLLSKSAEFEDITLVQPSDKAPTLEGSVGITCTSDTPITINQTFKVTCSHGEVQPSLSDENGIRMLPILKQGGQISTNLIWMTEGENDRIYGVKFIDKIAHFNLLGDQVGDYSVDFELLGNDKHRFNKPEIVSLKIGSSLDFAFELQNSSKLPKRTNYNAGEITVGILPTSFITGDSITINVNLKSLSVGEVSNVSLDKEFLTFTTANTEAQSVKILIDKGCIEKKECKEQNLALLFEVDENTLNGRSVTVPDAYTFNLEGNVIDSNKIKKETELKPNDAFTFLNKYKLQILGIVAVVLLLGFVYIISKSNNKHKKDTVNVQTDNLTRSSYY